MARAEALAHSQAMSSTAGHPPRSRSPFSSRTPNGAQSPPLEILMVEDSVTDAELAVRAFQRAKYTHPVRVVSTGAEGFDYLLGTGARATQGPARPRLILLDLALPDMTGTEFLRRVKNDPRTRTIPVIILSLAGSVRAILACEHLGSAGYLVKPIDFANFVRVTAKLELDGNGGAPAHS